LSQQPFHVATEPSGAAYAGTENDSPKSEILVAPFSLIWVNVGQVETKPDASLSSSMNNGEKPMKQNLTKVALAASAFVFAGLFSFGWSEQSGVSLSVEKAEARIGRPLTPMSVAGVARRQHRRAGYGYGAAAAVGTAAAVGATAPYYGGAGYYAGSPYYSGAVRGARAAYYDGSATQATPHYAVRAYYTGGPWYGYSGWDDYKARNAIRCTPGQMTKLDDGQMYVCQ